MAKIHKPKRGLGRTWIYTWLVDVLQECDLKTIEEYIGIRRQMIVVYMVARPILKTGRAKEGSGTTPLVVGTAHGPGH
jgi:hypothetical protein